MNAVEIEEAISDLVIQPFDRAEFPYQFLESFGNKDTTLTRLRKGNSNRTDVDGAVLQRTNIHILTTDEGGVEAGLKALRESPKTAQQKAKFIFATDGAEIQAEDLSSGDVLACAYTDLPTHFGFLLPLAGITTVSEIKNNPIDIKATGRLDKLYVALLQDERNKNWAAEKNRERFNHFMAQLIFCFFAEDTGIFRGDNLFTETVGQMSHGDPALTQEVITNIFAAMNLDPRKGERAQNGKEHVRPYADVFPYVNGGLFKDTASDVQVPVFDKMARTYLLRAGDLDWTAINPDIFGSMIQAVADDEERGELGMHYTSVPNILKVLNPLFLDSLNADLEKAGNNKQQLGKLKKRIARIRVFDPACGSGNFLVIAYKHMREIEHKANQAAGWETEKSVIPLTNFRGIELKSFAAEIARLALIIAEYQCDELYMGQREALALFLPLEKTNWITCGNALRLDWLSICPPTGETSVKLQGDDLFNTPLNQSEIDFENEGGETYICGNPPYLGYNRQTPSQKQDIESVLGKVTNRWKSLDYISAWFFKTAEMIKYGFSAGLVTTNSLNQGEHATILWPLIFSEGACIAFAVPNFKWSNSAAKNAGVIVSIVGLSENCSTAYLYDGDTKQSGESINQFLTLGRPVKFDSSSEVLSEKSPMLLGNMPKDGGHLILTHQELMDADIKELEEIIYLYQGAKEIIRGERRYCLWLADQSSYHYLEHPFVSARINGVKQMRLASKAKSTRDFAHRSHLFKQIQGVGKSSTILIAGVSSENREYLPVEIYPSKTIVAAPNFGIYDAPNWNIALIASKMHIVWVATVCGKLKSDYRYSNTLGWNTFPVPKLTSKNKADLTAAAENILLAREAHFPATIADLYKPDAMPKNLRAAHEENDRILEEIYIGRKFKNDTERLEKLFEMYTEMTTKVRT
jgi:hypothetical protein